MFKFLHAADLHLDSALRGLEQYEHAPADEIRGATRAAFENLVQLAIDERVSFVLLAGDQFDSEWPDFNTGLFYARQLQRLHEAGIRVVTIAGNHDAEHRVTKKLDLPAGVVDRLSTSRPETIELRDIDVAIHGQGFATGAVTCDLTEGYPRGMAGCFNIGLLHTCGIGAADGHQSYAPCTLDGLRQKNYQYWALGHVHKRQPIDCDEAEIHFPGNVQGRHMRETGPKGCLLVTVDDRRQATCEFRPLDVFRWELCKLDANGVEQANDLLALLPPALKQLAANADGRPLAVRVEVHGRCRAHEALAAAPERWVNEVRAAALSAGNERVWIEKVKFETALPSDNSGQLDGAVGELLALIDELRADDVQVASLADELADLKRKLPAELLEGPEPLAIDSPAQIRAALDGVQHLLVQRLLNSG